MKKVSLQSLGGQTRAKQQREIALACYYASPNYCLFCEKMIEVSGNERVCHIRKKKFCNRKCFFRFKVERVSNVAPNQPKSKSCQRCEDEIPPPNMCKKYCDTCRYAGYKTLDNVSKGELFSKSRNWQSARSSLRRHAYKTYKRTRKPMICMVCGYSKHVEIAHRRAVSDFDENALMSEINSPTNLIALCPNHHWELDNKMLSLYATAVS